MTGLKRGAIFALVAGTLGSCRLWVDDTSGGIAFSVETQLGHDGAQVLCRSQNLGLSLSG